MIFNLFTIGVIGSPEAMEWMDGETLRLRVSIILWLEWCSGDWCLLLWWERMTGENLCASTSVIRFTPLPSRLVELIVAIFGIRSIFSWDLLMDSRTNAADSSRYVLRSCTDN